VQDDAHSCTGGEDAPHQQEYDNAEENDHDQQEAPAAPLRRSSKDHVPSTSYASYQCVVLLSDGLEPECFSEANER
jgi:hypothetical protein